MDTVPVKVLLLAIGLLASLFLYIYAEKLMQHLIKKEEKKDASNIFKFRSEIVNIIEKYDSYISENSIRIPQDRLFMVEVELKLTNGKNIVLHCRDGYFSEVIKREIQSEVHDIKSLDAYIAEKCKVDVNLDHSKAA